MGDIAAKPDFRLSMSSNTRLHQKQGTLKLSELVKQSLLGRQTSGIHAPLRSFVPQTPIFRKSVSRKPMKALTLALGNRLEV
ncbi:MAG: hypothetical protein RL458_2909 [Pseudomonadota bacterium]|jgi:hypothetical protein